MARPRAMLDCGWCGRQFVPWKPKQQKYCGNGCRRAAKLDYNNRRYRRLKDGGERGRRK